MDGGIKNQAGAKALNADIRTNHGTFFRCLSVVWDFAASSRDGEPVSLLDITEICLWYLPATNDAQSEHLPKVALNFVTNADCA